MTREDASGPEHRPAPTGPSGALHPVAAVNLGVRCCVELATFASLGYWGASVSGSMAFRTLLAVAAPLVAIGVWSRWLAPRAPRRLTGSAALTVELSIFAAATPALVASGLGLVGLIYAALAAANAVLIRSPGRIRAMGQEAPATVAPVGTGRP
ncbi:MAG TPA: YrdB family protein [Acidimicrobiales bacterium]